MGALWLLGAGKLGGALLARWRLAGFDPVEVDTRRDVPVDGAPATLVLGVKPQVWREAVAPLADRLTGVRVVSLMAGVRTATLAAALPGATVIRSMPNTPVAVGAGMTGLFGTGLTQADRAAAEALFAPTGATVWVDDEASFDALGAVSGSGPAFIFAFVEALAAAGQAEGLDEALAARLAAATLVGSGALLGPPGGQRFADPATLRAAVTSPKGTTAAGLAKLMPSLGPALRATVAASIARSQELAREV
ncbi:MAG: pyrroline-5-carboxylate reductase [Sphingomonadaceae bacterium]|nr:pyrroline-5-carboxylate reductase [Sphingomonadaceae bacterium]